MTSPIVSAYIPTKGAKQTLRYEAAKRDLSVSKYCGLLLEKVTNRFTSFPNPEKLPTRSTHNPDDVTHTFTVHIYVSDLSIKNAIVNYAEKYSLSTSKYCTYLLTLATNNFTDFDLPNVPTIKVLRKKKDDNGKAS